MAKYGRSKMPLHVRISYRGWAEQFGTIFASKKHTKKYTKETKGISKHNDKRRGVHPSGTKKRY